MISKTNEFKNLPFKRGSYASVLNKFLSPKSVD